MANNCSTHSRRATLVSGTHLFLFTAFVQVISSHRSNSIMCDMKNTNASMIDRKRYFQDDIVIVKVGIATTTITIIIIIITATANLCVSSTYYFTRHQNGMSARSQ